MALATKPRAADRRTRRRHPRASLPATALLFTNRPIGPCIVEDLSVGGLRVVADASIRRGRVLTVLLDLPGSAPLTVSAQVTRHQRRKGEDVLGLAFLNLPRQDAKRLGALVAHALAETTPCLEFFDTSDDGRLHRLVLAEDAPVVD
jgi:hypothetical protein